MADSTQSEVGVGQPLISGPAHLVTAGIVATLMIFVVGLMLIIRGRVTHAKPRKSKHVETTYFEPAGEDAEIEFDDDPHAAQDSKAARKSEHWRDDKDGETEVTIEHGDDDHEMLTAPEAPLRPEKKKSAFASLFSKKPAPAPEPVAEYDDEYADHVEETDFEAGDESETGYFAEDPVEEPAPEPREAPHWRDASPQPSPLAAAGATERISHAEEAAEAAMQRAEAAEALARDLKRANEEAQHVITLGLRKQEAALNERTEALIAVEKRLSALSDEFHSRAQAATLAAAALPDAHGDTLSGVSEDHFAEFANLMGEQFDALRSTVNGAIERLSKRLDHLPAAPSGAGTATAARVQLSDLLGDALASQRFKLRHELSTGRTADAVILMPGPMAPLAIDARFPAEAFDAWQLSRNPATEMELRRAVLRNIADAGEKLISPDETADCALMFVPSEHILSELHANFSDLVQESYRARVWMVSPTSLMATLHTISAILSGAGIREASTASVIDELSALRGRVSALESQRSNGAHHPSEGAPQKAPAASTPQRAGETAREKPSDDKSPFPLR